LEFEWTRLVRNQWLGVKQIALSSQLQLQSNPVVFCCGEMLDWDAPTGGYLLTACFATGRAAGTGVHQYLISDTIR
jgi:predicted flavoprotein YhiN